MRYEIRQPFHGEMVWWIEAENEEEALLIAADADRDDPQVFGYEEVPTGPAFPEPPTIRKIDREGHYLHD